MLLVQNHSEKAFHPSQFTRKMFTILVSINVFFDGGKNTKKKNTVTYHIVMIRKSVMINNKETTDEKLDGRKPSLFAWSFGHFNKHL
jgi:hypothetical protein